MKGKNGATLISFAELMKDTRSTHTTLHKYLKRAKIRPSKTIRVGNGVLRFYDPERLVAFKKDVAIGKYKEARGRPRTSGPDIPVLKNIAPAVATTTVDMPTLDELDKLRQFMNPLPEMEIILMRYQNFVERRLAHMQDTIDQLNRSVHATLFPIDTDPPAHNYDYLEPDYFRSTTPAPQFRGGNSRETATAPSLAR